MKVIVDTSVWSLHLRHKQQDNKAVGTLRRLLREKRVQMLGVVRQELLSGVKEQTRFDKLLAVLNGFPSLLPGEEDYTTAARCYNICRARGVQGSSVDFLICAQAINHRLPILSTDKDFLNYARHVQISLFEEVQP